MKILTRTQFPLALLLGVAALPNLSASMQTSAGAVYSLASVPYGMQLKTLTGGPCSTT